MKSIFQKYSGQIHKSVIERIESDFAPGDCVRVFFAESKPSAHRCRQASASFFGRSKWRCGLTRVTNCEDEPPASLQGIKVFEFTR